MSSVLKVDQIQSDTGTVNVTSNLQFSGSSSTLQVGKALYLANTNNFALQFQDDVAGRLRIASSYSTFGDNNPFIIERPSAGAVQNDAITIRSGGVVDLGKGQLKFPASQNASADANTLDDYEEGTWAPEFLGGSSNPTASYNEQNGRYTKIGRVVTFSISIQSTTQSGGSGSLQISLPFTAAAPWQGHITIGYAFGLTTAVRGSGYTESGQAKFFIGQSGSNNTNLSTSALPGSTVHIIAGGTYIST